MRKRKPYRPPVRSLRVLNKHHPLVELGLRYIRPPITKSGFSTWCECPRKFFWQECMGLRRRAEVPPESLVVGLLFHSAIESILRGEDPAAKLEKEARQMVGKVEGSMSSAAAEFPSIVLRCKQKAMAMAGCFESVVRKQVGNPVSIEEVILVVERFQRSNKVVMLGGRIDLLYQTDDGEFVVVDWKTTSKSPVSFTRSIPMSIAHRIYRLLVKHKIGKSPKQFVHYVIKVPSIRQRKNETWEDYLERVRSIYESYDPADPPIVRSVIPYDDLEPSFTKGQVEELVRIQRAIDSRNINMFPQFGAEHGCSRNGRLCPYISLCEREATPELWPEIILSQFVQEFRYDPDGE